MNLSEDRDLTPAEAEAMLPGGPVIHTYAQVPGGYLGEDMPRDKVLALLGEGAVIRRSGERERSLGHGLAVLTVRDGLAGVTWIETERCERLHLAIRAYAEYLAGTASESEMQAAAASLSPAELAEYDQITAYAKARFRRNMP